MRKILRKRWLVTTMVGVFGLVGVLREVTATSAVKKPNVVVILLDDVGFGALGAFGGPIHTPNIDRLAARGLRYNNFHTTALCSPTRAALLSGRNHHSVGTGVITELATDFPGYTGRIPKSAALIPRILKDNGYATFGLGKWHNTPSYEVTTKGPYELWPNTLGFEKFYGFMAGDTSQWEPVLWENFRPVEPSKKAGYHLTPDMTDHALTWMNEARTGKTPKPFFLYYAPGAGHAPHHAPAEYVAKYKGKFDQGWDKVREETLSRQKELGIVPQETVLSPRPEAIQAWDSLSKDEKRLFARMMEVFAGFVEHTDHEVGRLLDAIDKMGVTENTLVILASDNGASGEGGLIGSTNEMIVFNGLTENMDENLKAIDSLGGPQYFNHYPAGWALAMNTPCKYWKQFTHEGGVRDPFIIAWPSHIKDKGAIRSQFVHAIDIVPTVLALTGISAPKSVDGVKQKPIEGVSMEKHLLDANSPTAKKMQYFEMFANRGIWANGWKAVTWHERLPWQTGALKLPKFEDDKWELYDTAKDMNEVHDVAKLYPEKVAEMKILFNQEAEKYNVYPLDDSSLSGRVKALKEKFTAGRYEFTYEGVRERIPEDLSPPVKNRSFSITADVEIPQTGCEGVLAHAGGRFGGYSLYCKDGTLAYAHNFVGEHVYTVSSTSTVPSGKVTLRFEFEKTGVVEGITKGTGKLFVNGKKVGEGFIDKTVPGIYSGSETFDIGVATVSAVTEAIQTPFAFTGKIQKIVFRLAKEFSPGPAPMLND